MTPDAPVQQKSWLGRNWKWLLPVGCLLPVLCCGSFVGTIFFTVTKAMQASDAFKQGLIRANENAEVQTLLGTPLSPGMTATGSLENNVSNFDAAIKGPKGEGTLHVEAREGGGVVTYSALEVRANGKVINLLRPPGPPTRGADGQPDEGDEVNDGEDADDGDDAPTKPE